MATTVTYKGETLTTVENATKKLLTAGKYCEDDITLEDVSGGGVTAVFRKLTVVNSLTHTTSSYTNVNIYGEYQRNDGKIAQSPQRVTGGASKDFYLPYTYASEGYDNTYKSYLLIRTDLHVTPAFTGDLSSIVGTITDSNTRYTLIALPSNTNDLTINVANAT